jgi:uncharacterized protein (DUF2147 family)
VNRKLPAALACLILTLLSPALWAAGTPVGFWLTQEGTSVVQLAESGGRIGGRIVWLKEPNFPAGDAQGRAGKPKLDEHNPDAAQRGRKLLGTTIVWGFAAPNADGVCEGGRVYDPRNGKTYSGTITMVGPDKLDLRGYVMVSMIGRTSSWTRVDPGKYGLKP